MILVNFQNVFISLQHLILCISVKDYTQTSENKLSSARSWSITIIRCSYKILFKERRTF